ncbi:P63C domain-containing protein [Sphingobacterium sp.]|uniref:P63C domain-containing protein n=1 Tax=Sphingobacterium sp. TaxID=341027 RepID=UPI00289DD40B|nr:P63C domain-containing protein [Sphingobacterium sp.]
MEKNKDKAIETIEGQEPASSSIVDRQSVLELFKDLADNKAEQVYISKLKRERETIELLGGGKTSLYDEQKKKAKLIESFPQKHGAKYSQFFDALAELAKWTDEQKKSFHKPQVAPRIINNYIYSRFPPEVLSHILEKNPYVKWCLREHKHYLFLGEDGILMLEKFIDDAVTVMKECTTVYEFEKLYSMRFGKDFQPVLFEKYLGLIS